MGMFRRKTEQPPDTSAATLVGSTQLGGDGGSGMTHGYLAANITDAGGRVDMLGRIEQPGTAIPQQDLPPASLYADRPLYGGIRTAPATREYVAEPGMTGGYTVITERPRVQLGEITVMQATPPASVRQAPADDDNSTGSCAQRAKARTGPAGDLSSLQRDTVGSALGWDRR